MQTISGTWDVHAAHAGIHSHTPSLYLRFPLAAATRPMPYAPARDKEVSSQPPEDRQSHAGTHPVRMWVGKRLGPAKMPVSDMPWPCCVWPCPEALPNLDFSCNQETELSSWCVSSQRTQRSQRSGEERIYYLPQVRRIPGNFLKVVVSPPKLGSFKLRVHAYS